MKNHIMKKVKELLNSIIYIRIELLIIQNPEIVQEIIFGVIKYILNGN